MKKIAKKKHYNKIAIVLLVVLLCNFLLPTCKIIASDNEISKPEGPLTLFFCAIGDILLNLLQENIVGVSGLKYAGEYELKYSPGVIFSGDLAAFDINFIHLQLSFLLKLPFHRLLKLHLVFFLLFQY